MSFLDSLLVRNPRPGPLGRRTPASFSHVEKYALAAAPIGAVSTGIPVTIGVNWYSEFDTPEKLGGLWWVARNGKLSSIRGGHCVCLKEYRHRDPWWWWLWYDQGREGACVGFGTSRMMSLIKRKRYDARWLWDRAKERDEWPETHPGDDYGTSVKAAVDVLVNSGHVPWNKAYSGREWEARAQEAPVPSEGASTVRWATTVDEIRGVLDSPNHDKLQAVPMLNSWGRSYPHVVWLPYVVLERLLQEDGEAALITAR